MGLGKASNLLVNTVEHLAARELDNILRRGKNG